MMMFLFFLLMSSDPLHASGSAEPQTELEKNFFELGGYASVKIDLRYATTNNFLNENIYGSFKKAYLHRDAKAQFESILLYLNKTKPGWKLLIFDALRPHAQQKKLWHKVEGSSDEQYVMDPRHGSIHSYGFALDLSLLDEKGREVDMGTGFDSFSKVSQPRHEEKFLASGELNAEQVAHRKLLRDIMAAGGFKVIPNEWWHFEAKPSREIRGVYPLFDEE